MSWIKRNLYFVILSVVGLALMGVAGWFAYSKWNANNLTLSSLNDDYSHLRDLNNQNPHPGSGQIDNIKTAKEQREELLASVKKTRVVFEPITPIPNETKITDRDFSAALSQTIAQLQRAATNSSVIVPPNYFFSFEAQKTKVSFAAGSPGPLSIQLGEVSTICRILFESKVNSLDNIRRERVSNDDANGPQTDYLTEKSVTNDLAIMTPYEITFRCFSTELAAVLSGFATSPSGFVVKSLNVDLAPAPPPTEQSAPLVTTYVMAQPAASTVNNPAMEEQMARQRMMSRYGLGGGRGEGGANLGGVAYRGLGGAPAAPVMPPPGVAPAPGAASGSKGGLQTVLDEKQLKVTMNLILFKLLPEKPLAAK
jgi:hypothetical protein